DLALKGLQPLRVCRADGRQRERGSKGGLADRHGGLLHVRAYTRFWSSCSLAPQGARLLPFQLEQDRPPALYLTRESAHAPPRRRGDWRARRWRKAAPRPRSAPELCASTAVPPRS